MIYTTSITVGVPVLDLRAGVAWYGRLLDSPAPDVQPVEGVVEYELHPGSWLQLFVGDAGSGQAVVRLGVGDLQAHRERLGRDGIHVGGVEHVEGVIDYVEFLDPWGNRLSLYQELDSAMPGS